MKAWTSITRLARRGLAALAPGLVTAAAATAAAAAPAPAQHFPLVPLGGEPLKEGFVEVIHPNGPQVYARHVYMLNGARSDQSYHVVISIWTSNLACSGSSQYALPAAVVNTNASGNGQGGASFDPELLAALGLRGLTVGGNVSLFREGAPAYTTGCRAIQLD